MNNDQLVHRLGQALNEYTRDVPLPHLQSPAFHSRSENNFSRPLGLDDVTPKTRGRRTNLRRSLMVVIVAIVVAGAGTAVAAASGAFDQSAHRVAVQTIQQFVRTQMEVQIKDQFAGEFRSAAKSLKPKDVRLQTTAQGPGHSTLMVWTYSNPPNGPWCSLLISTVPGRAAPLADSMICQVAGRSFGSVLASEDQWPCTPVPRHPQTMEPSFFVVTAQVPAGVAKVVVHTADAASIEAAVTNGWFIAISKRFIPIPIPVTYLNASGDIIGTGMVNPSSSSC